MGRTLPSLFKGTNSTLKKVVIFSNLADVSLAPTIIESPIPWTDYERIEFVYSGGGGDSVVMEPTILTDLEITKKPTSWKTLGTYHHNTLNTIWNVIVTANGANTATVAYTNDRRLHSIVGYTRREAHENFCQEVILKAGAHVSAGEELEVDIATYLGKDYLNQDLLIEAYVWNNSGSGTEDWFKVDTINSYYTDRDYPRGIRTELKKETGKIWLAAGSEHISEQHSRIPNSAGAGYITASKVKLKVWRITALNMLISGAGGGGSGFPIYQVISAGTELAIGGGYAVDTSTGAKAVVLPSSPKAGDVVYIKDYAGTTTKDNAIIINSFKPIHGRAMQYAIISRNASVVFSYIDDIVGWCLVGGIGIEGGDVIPYEEVMLLPVDGTRKSSNAWTPFTLPNNYKWSDFSHFELGCGHKDLIEVTVGTTTILQEDVAYSGLGMQFTASYSYLNDQIYQATIRIDTDTTGSYWNDGGGYGTTKYLKGYTKYKPSTQNGLVRLYKGEAQSLASGTITLEQPMTDFDAIVVTTQVGDSSGTHPSLCYETIPVASIVGVAGNHYVARNWSDNGTQWNWSFYIKDVTASTLTFGGSVSNSVGPYGIIEIRGINFKNAGGVAPTSQYPTRWQDFESSIYTGHSLNSADTLEGFWSSEDTFELVGIIRCAESTWPNGQRAIMRLPSTNYHVDKIQYRPASQPGAADVYVSVDGGDDMLKITTSGATQNWVMLDIKLRLTPIS